MLRFHNTLTGSVEDFSPLEAGRVGMYNCGPTVYDFIHIGNLRSYVFADTLRRAFEYEGLVVKQVINITDVGHLTGDNEGDADTGEDKMEKGAKREGKSAAEIAAFYTEDFFDNLRILHIETDNTVFPKATEHIAEQIALIAELERKNFTYLTTDGMYFDTAKFPDYGKLGNINLEGLEAGARIGVNDEKRNPTDFALWKFNTTGQKREQEWESPWGVGFPGWHIECSAMSMKYLGETFDVHTGGVDHIPVHHQNEIAQSEAATGKKFVHYWLHNEFMKVNGEKMSKSLKNTYLLRDLTARGFFPLAYRYLLLLSHYRTQTNFTWEALQAAQNAYRKLKETIASLPDGGTISLAHKEEFTQAIENDLNTPEALGALWKLMKDPEVTEADKRATALDFDRVLGLNLTQNEFAITEIPANVQTLLTQREAARKEKDFATADVLRDQIREKGFAVKDSGDDQTLEKI